MAAQPDDLQDWTPVERALLRPFRIGDTFDLNLEPDGDDASDPAAMAVAQRTVRAEVLQHLILGAGGDTQALRLSGAYIVGSLDLSGADISCPLEFRNCRFEQPVVLPEARLLLLRMDNCWLPRLEAARVRTEGDLALTGCTLEGGIRLTGAVIGIDLDLQRSTVGPDRMGRSVVADGVQVTVDLDAELIDSTGEFSLRSARIGSQFNLRGCRLRAAPPELTPRSRWVLNAPHITVERDVLLDTSSLASPHLPGEDQGTASEGREPVLAGGVRFDDGRIGGEMRIDGARFVLASGQDLSFRRLHTAEFRFLPTWESNDGFVMLSHASVGMLVDSLNSWPFGRYRIPGLAYDSLVPQGSFPLRERIAWLDPLGLDYEPEAYEHLAKVLRSSDEHRDADTVLHAKLRRRRDTLSPAVRVWDFVQDVTFGYGYRPGRAALWLAALWGMGSLYFSQNPPAPMQQGEGPAWSASAYTLDLLLPILDFGQENQWRITGISQWVAISLVILGWILATTVAAGAAAVILRRN